MWNDHVCVLSLQPCPTLCSPVTVAHQAPLPMEFSRQEYWSGLPFPPPGDLPNPGTEPMSPASPALAGGFLPLCHLGSLEWLYNSQFHLWYILKSSGNRALNRCLCIHVHTSLFLIAQRWKQLIQPWMKKTWNICTRDDYLVLKIWNSDTCSSMDETWRYQVE